MNTAPKNETRAVSTINDTAITPMQMLQVAVQQGQGLDTIRELMDLEREWKKDKAREAYYAALAEFKKEPIKVTKDKKNTQYESMYTTLGNLVNTVNAAMAPHGLNARWTFEQTDRISVTCILSHTLGYSENVTLSGAPDTSGSKNPLQQIKSTVTYLEGATFQAVTGVVSQDATLDDDGNGAGLKTINEEQLANLEALITEVAADRPKFLKYCKVEDLANLPEKFYSTAVKALEKKRKQP
jgi:hypothetical protein